MESKFHWQRIRNQVPGIRNPQLGFRNPSLSRLPYIRWNLTTVLFTSKLTRMIILHLLVKWLLSSNLSLFLLIRQLLCPALIQLLGSPLTDLNKRPKANTQFQEEINRGGRGIGNFAKSTAIVGPIPRTIYNIATELLRLVGPLAAMRPVLESLFHRIILYPPAQQRTEALRALKEVWWTFSSQRNTQQIIPFYLEGFRLRSPLSVEKKDWRKIILTLYKRQAIYA